MTATARRPGLLSAILASSLALRVLLALRGGQYFFNDEPRYHRGIDLWQALQDGHWGAARELLAMPEHAAFTWLGALLTPFQHGLACLAGRGDWSDPSNLFASAGLAAALLSLFPVLNLWLAHRLARAVGADEDEARWAVLLMALSNTLLYYSRHLLPYDAALSAWLGALWLSASPAPRRRLAGGLLAGLTYHVYNGFWFLPPLALLWACLHPGRATPGRPRLDLRWFAGGVIGLGLPLLVGTLAGGARYWHILRAFSATAGQGVFTEGWSLPWAYLWHSETALGVLTVAVILAAVIRSRGRLPAHVRAWAGLLVAAYALLVLLSTGLGKFVVYGRTVHPLVPLFCLLGGWAAASLLAAAPRWRPAAMLAVTVLGLLPVPAHVTRLFPREVELQVLGEVGIPKHALSVTGTLYRPLALPVTRPNLALVNAQFLFPVRDYAGYPAGRVLFSLPHPLAYAPYQYDGHSPRERALLRGHDLAIRLILLENPAAVPDHPPPSSLFTGQDRPDGRDRGR